MIFSPFMNRLNILFLLVSAYAAFDLFRTLRTGRAHGRWSGTITRERQPKRIGANCNWESLAFALRLGMRRAKEFS